MRVPSGAQASDPSLPRSRTITCGFRLPSNGVTTIELRATYAMVLALGAGVGELPSPIRRGVVSPSVIAQICAGAVPSGRSRGFGSPPRSNARARPSKLHASAPISTPTSPVYLVSCRDVNELFADGSATQMLRLPSASKIQATLEPAGAAVSPLGNGALSAASTVNDGCCAAAVPMAKAPLARRTDRDRV